MTVGVFNVNITVGKSLLKLLKLYNVITSVNTQIDNISLMITFVYWVQEYGFFTNLIKPNDNFVSDPIKCLHCCWIDE